MYESIDNFHTENNARLDRAKVKKVEIKNFKEKADFLESCGWEAKYNINNWTKKGHQDSNGYWKDYPEYSMDDAYHKCKESLTLTVKEKDIVIALLKENKVLSKKESALLKRLQTI